MLRKIITRVSKTPRNLNILGTKSITTTYPSLCIINSSYQPTLTLTPSFCFAKISKKQKEKQKADEQKKKAKEEIGDITTFDLNPYESRYIEAIDKYEKVLKQYKVGRLDSSLFANIHVKIGNNSFPLQQLTQIAPKSANTCILNPFDHDNLDAIQKAVQASDLGLQITKSDKTILLTQPPNSMKQIKQKYIQKMKKNTENAKQKMNNIRNDSKDDLKKYKKVIPEDRYKIIQKQLNSLHDKFNTRFEKITKQKETELRK